MTFYELRIASLNQLTADSIEIGFDVPDNLREQFRFKPGQYITVNFNGEKRDYSLCTSPLENRWAIAVKLAQKGKFSNYLRNDLKTGDFMGVSRPKGDFGIPEGDGEKRAILAFAAGSGITPIMSILKHTLANEDKVKFYLFYSNRTPEHVMFFEELKELKEQYPGNFYPHFIYSRHKVGYWFFEGRLNSEKIGLISNHLIDINEIDEAIVCGPSEMIKSVSAEIFKAGLPKEKIHFELFNFEPNPLDLLEVELKSPDIVNVEAIVDGEEHSFVWEREKNLADAMSEAGIEPPYHCNGYSCSTCLCRLIEGEVYLIDNKILAESDIEKGVVLTCISRPKSKHLKLDFDVVQSS